MVDVAVLDCLPHAPHLEPDLHDPGPLDVVGFSEGRPPNTGTNIPDHSPDLVEAAVLVVAAAVAVRASTWSAGVLGCPLRRPLLRHFGAICVGAVVRRRGAAGTAGAAAECLGIRRSLTGCFCCCCCFYLRPGCFYLRSGCCQLRCSQPRHSCRRSSRCYSRSLTLLCHGALGLLPAPHARGSRVLRATCRHGSLQGGCCVKRRLMKTSCCSTVRREEGNQRQTKKMLLPTWAAHRKCSGYRLTRL